MKKRKLGTTDIEISEIGLGTNYVGGHNMYENIDEDEGIRILPDIIPAREDRRRAAVRLGARIEQDAGQGEFDRPVDAIAADPIGLVVPFFVFGQRRTGGDHAHTRTSND